MALNLGARFPLDVATQAPEGPRTIGGLLTDGPLVVAFHRLWCPFCQQAARDLDAVDDELRAMNARVVIVYREDPDTVSSSCAQRGLHATCLSDADRRLETAAEVDRFSLARYGLFSPRRLVAALRSGSRMAMGRNVLQGRGTYVLDTSGRVVFAHQARTAADIPRVQDIVDAVRSVSTSTPR